MNIDIDSRYAGYFPRPFHVLTHSIFIVMYCLIKL